MIMNGCVYNEQYSIIPLTLFIPHNNGNSYTFYSVLKGPYYHLRQEMLLGNTKDKFFILLNWRQFFLFVSIENLVIYLKKK